LKVKHEAIGVYQGDVFDIFDERPIIKNSQEDIYETYKSKVAGLIDYTVDSYN
jgi:hypothetical protein